MYRDRSVCVCVYSEDNKAVIARWKCFTISLLETSVIGGGGDMVVKT